MSLTNPTPSPEKIIHDNKVMHDMPGYARFYDENLGIVKNSWERRIFLSRLSDINRRLEQRFTGQTIRSLDLGAGTGNLTLTLLRRGHHVTAVDMSSEMLKQLTENCRKGDVPTRELEMMCAPVDEVLQQMLDQHRTFHLVTACSFYHHLPDYLATLELATRTVAPGGFLFLAHEPMRKDTIGGLSRLAQAFDFKLWRLKVHAKRLVDKTAWSDEYYDPESQADYWDLTTGCDQERMASVLESRGFKTELTCYDSRRSRAFHYMCRMLRTQTLFMIVAEKS